MQCIDHKRRKPVTIDGATFVLRPLTAAARVAMTAAASGRARLLAMLEGGIESADGLLDANGKPMAFDAAALPSDGSATLELLAEIDTLTREVAGGSAA